MRVCVFGSSSKETPKAYLDASRELGVLLAKKGHVCVTGGGLFGCMGAVNDAVVANKGKAEGVIHKMWVGGNLDEEHKGVNMTVVGGKTLAQRKHALCEKSDCFISLPGGVGTWDELFEVLCERQIGMRPRPVALVNTDGYYDGILAQIKRAQKDKITYMTLENLCFVAKNAQEALAYCEAHAGKAQAAAKPTDENRGKAEVKGPKTADRDPKKEAKRGAEKQAALEKMAAEARGMSLRLQALDTKVRTQI
jgi:uncharacterized protein (TIGR00730 family)